VCGSAEAHAAAVRAQLTVMETYEQHGEDDDTV
jgi:hypothetical protein